MIIRSKLIPMIMVVSFFGLIAVAIVSQRTLVGASLAAHAAVVVPGPSQFYAQHNIVSDISGLADHTDSNVVNAWGLDAGPTTPCATITNGPRRTRSSHACSRRD